MPAPCPLISCLFSILITPSESGDPRCDLPLVHGGALGWGVPPWLHHLISQVIADVEEKKDGQTHDDRVMAGSEMLRFQWHFSESTDGVLGVNSSWKLLRPSSKMACHSSREPAPWHHGARHRRKRTAISKSMRFSSPRQRAAWKVKQLEGWSPKTGEWM